MSAPLGFVERGSAWIALARQLVNQPRFQIQFPKNYPRRNLKNNAEKVVGLHRQLRWRAEPLQTSFSNSVRASFRICSQEEFSDFSDRTRQRPPKARLAHCRKKCEKFLLAGVEGFEPPNAWTKTMCLTTWRHPNSLFCYGNLCDSAK